MHDTDLFARMPALDSTAEQPPLAEILLLFETECDVLFKDEIYSVRDNGAVLRHARPDVRRRKLDDFWTFGTLNRHSGYFESGGHVVHRIVATAFHGPQPSPEHVVDHIDTNRLNNRADNLRWVTRLENILLNPITRARIEIAFGSLDAFFENPGACTIPHWDWMKVVTREQAQESRTRLLAWAETKQLGRGGALGNWLYAPIAEPPLQIAQASGVHVVASVEAAQREALDVPVFESGAGQGDAPRRRRAAVALPPEPIDIPSLTAGAIQRRWRTPTEFPQCPATVSVDALAKYLARLELGTVFARNRYGDNVVSAAATGPDGMLSVVCSMPSGVKDWSHARVFLEGDVFCHESGGTFFTLEGAMKAHFVAIGGSVDAYAETIDDYC
ncbi:HNH endonuclease [Mesorhizobium sp. M1005]|uniref:HNH endonuclease signature motif containing protein n=1 Tax=unclassified Mesorhizobium TaxID=325217 RepID=UPI003336EA14